MSEPEHNQAPQPSADGNGVGAVPVAPSPTSSGTTAQPAYGRYHQPEYGAMDSQFPPDYDPYLFGHPDPTPAPRAETPHAAAPAARSVRPAPTGPSAQETPVRPDGARSRYPRYVNGVDMEDPNQNIYYGHWDFGAVIAFVFALFLPVPVLPAVFGAVSMYRTRVLRMKGHALAVAALIINVLYTIAFVWLTIKGVSMDDAMNQMLQTLRAATSQDGSISA